MSFSLPNTEDDIFTSGWLHHSDRSTTSLNQTAIPPHIAKYTLWAALVQSKQCQFFRDVVYRSLAFNDFNNPYGMYKTVFVPVCGTAISNYTEQYILNSLTINTKFLLPVEDDEISNVKIQNNEKEYISLSSTGDDRFVVVFDMLWRIVVPNISCINGIIHIIEPILY